MSEPINSAAAPLTIDRITCHGTQLASNCPCCQQPLIAGSLDERPTLYCEFCYGVLMKKEYFGAALRERRSRRGNAEGEEPRPIDMSQYDRRIRCPGCYSLMDVHPYYGPGNVVIDTCAGCGYLWLDHGEFSQLERAADGRMVSGGFPRLNASNDHVSIQQAPAAANVARTARHPLEMVADWLFGCSDE